MKRTLHETVLFDLLKISLWNQKPTINYTDLTDKDWKGIYQLTAEQGVQSLAFDGVIRLPEEWQPEEVLLLTWVVNTNLQEQRYLRHVIVTDHIDKIFKAQGLDMLLLKGQGLAAFYPNPAHREYGDIDIYVNEYKLGNHLLAQHGKQSKEHPKHSVFNFEGIPVENHRTFIDLIKLTHISGKNRRMTFDSVEKELHDILVEERTSPVGICGIQTPSATFNFLFLLMHTGSHLSEELVVRHLCDWACFLTANKGRYDEKRIERVLKFLNFQKMCFLMTDIAIQCLGMPLEFAPSFYRVSNQKRLKARFADSLFHRFPGSMEVKRNTLWCKWRRFYSKQWKYDLFYKEWLPERLLRVLIVWLDKHKRIK